MPGDLPIRCACGALRGTAHAVSGEVGNRVVCYCDDCQAFARFLGRADSILDEHGGTGIFQTSPARLTIETGRDRIACLRLTPNGLLRWYAACCHTPLGNTLAWAQAPFVGLILAGLGSSADGRTCEEVLGPVRWRVMARFAQGGREALGGLDASDRPPIAMVVRSIGMLLAARLRGEHLRSPFFDPHRGTPVATPRVLTPAERTALAEACDAAAP